MSAATNWREILKAPALGDHIVQVYQDEEFLAEAVGEYIGVGLRQDEGAIVIATLEHRRGVERAPQPNRLPAAPASAPRPRHIISADARPARCIRACLAPQ